MSDKAVTIEPSDDVSMARELASKLTCESPDYAASDLLRAAWLEEIRARWRGIIDLFGPGSRKRFDAAITLCRDGGADPWHICFSPSLDEKGVSVRIGDNVMTARSAEDGCCFLAPLWWLFVKNPEPKNP